MYVIVLRLVTELVLYFREQGVRMDDASSRGEKETKKKEKEEEEGEENGTIQRKKEKHSRGANKWRVANAYNAQGKKEGWNTMALEWKRKTA